MNRQLPWPNLDAASQDSKQDARSSRFLFNWSDEQQIAKEASSGVLDELLKVHEYERQRLGQELHDSAGQLVVALQLSVAHLRNVEADSSHDDLLDEIQDTVRQIDREIRALAFLHYPAELGDRDLSGAIRSLARGFEQRTGISTIFKAVGDVEKLDQPLATTLLRIAQEALVNIHRHARASSVTIRLRRVRNSLELSVSDDGVGIPAKVLANAHGIGLQGMRHRVESLGGEFRIRNLEQGTEVTATVPLRG